MRRGWRHTGCFATTPSVVTSAELTAMGGSGFGCSMEGMVWPFFVSGDVQNDKSHQETKCLRAANECQWRRRAEEEWRGNTLPLRPPDEEINGDAFPPHAAAGELYPEKDWLSRSWAEGCDRSRSLGGSNVLTTRVVDWRIGALSCSMAPRGVRHHDSRAWHPGERYGGL